MINDYYHVKEPETTAQKLKKKKNNQSIYKTDNLNFIEDSMKYSKHFDIVKTYSKYVNNILNQSNDPYIRKKYSTYLEITNPKKHDSFYMRMQKDASSR